MRYSLACDWPACKETFTYTFAFSSQTLRDVAAGAGWTQSRGQDFCPPHDADRTPEPIAIPVG